MKRFLPEAADRTSWRRVTAAGPSLPLTLALVLLAAFVGAFVVRRLGVDGLALVMVGLAGISMLAYVSFRSLTFALVLWMVSMGSVRLVGLVGMPGLPDFSTDRFLMVWIALVFLIKLIADRGRLQGPMLADFLLIGHTLVVLVNIQVTGSIHVHAWVLSNLAPLFAYLYGRHVVKDERSLRLILISLLLMTIYFDVTAVAEQMRWTWLVWPKQILDKNVGMWAEGRSRGPVAHPPVFGQLLSMFVLLVFYFLMRAVKSGQRVLFTILAGLTMLAQLYTYTRGPWLATVVAIMAMAVLRAPYRRLALALSMGALMIGVLGPAFLTQNRFLQERMQNVNTIENRLSMLATATRMIRDNPFMGVGYLRYKEFREKYNQAAYVPFYGLVRKKFGEGVVPHDIFLGRAVEEGMISLVVFLAFLFIIGRAWLRQWRANPQGAWFNRDLLALFAGMMISYLVGGMVIDYRYFDLVNVVFCLLAGILYGYRCERYARPDLLQS